MKTREMNIYKIEYCILYQVQIYPKMVCNKGIKSIKNSTVITYMTFTSIIEMNEPATEISIKPSNVYTIVIYDYKSQKWLSIYKYIYLKKNWNPMLPSL